MNTHLRLLIVTSISTFLFYSCAKGPGEGGRATIQGKVFATNYSNSFIKNDSGYIGGQKVFIQYGDEVGVSDNTDTDNDGIYTFRFLREGKYTVYVYSKKLTNNALDTFVVKNVEITSRKQVLEVSQMNINTFKN